MATLTSMDVYSSNPIAVRTRVRRLLNDAYDESCALQKKRSRDSKKAKAVLEFASGKASPNRSKYLTTRIAHHLSRGRSIADIVVRENAPVSLVKQLIAAMEAVK